MELRHVFDELQTRLTPAILRDILSKINAISERTKGDGAGLSGGFLVDMFLTEYLSTRIDTFTECHIGESDCCILNVPLSIKKISGKSSIALDWSKNGETTKSRERFTTDMIIVNLKTQQWWKKEPTSGCISQEEKDSSFYSTIIKSGLYVISKTYCKDKIKLSSNNKTDSLIDNISLYKMLKQSIKENMFIEFPTEIPECKFNILNAFV
jgi:hypothetical protein